jgi:hypothetical protein
MITVRFPSGFSVQYNDACYLRYGSAADELYTADPDKGGTWVATVQRSAGAVIEVRKPCRAYRAIDDLDDVFASTKRLLEKRPTLSYSQALAIAELRRTIERTFNARSRTWK